VSALITDDAMSAPFELHSDKRARERALELQRRASQLEARVQDAFDKLDVNKDGKIDEHHILLLLDELGVLQNLRSTPADYLTHVFSTHDKDHNKVLTFDEFRDFYNAAVADAEGSGHRPKSAAVHHRVAASLHHAASIEHVAKSLADHPHPAIAAAMPPPCRHSVYVPKKSEAQRQCIANMKECQEEVKQLNAHERRLSKVVHTAEEAEEELHHAVEDMKEEWRLLEQHVPKWRAAISDFVPQMHATDKPRHVLHALLDCLVSAEPTADVKGCVLVQGGDPHQPDAPVHLMVEQATREVATAREKQGALWHHSSKAGVSVDAFVTLDENKPLLRSPHGTANARSAVPLRAKAADAKPYGVLLSGPPALPDALLEEVAKWAGPIYADHWRRDALHALMEKWAMHVRGGLPAGRIGQAACLLPS
jgi:hypothetical protein